MISQNDIRSILTSIATNNGLVGDSVNMLVDELVYNLYHQQLEVVNAIQESNLSTAKLLNSKIRSCMNVMYPVYRGKNARVKLNFKNNVNLLSYNKFDLVYTSNTFKVYADESDKKTGWQFTKSKDNDDIKTFIGILSKSDILQQDFTITKFNKYYLDFTIDYEVIDDISEDVQVFFKEVDKDLNTNWVEYPTTRNFYDFIQQPHSGITQNVAYRVGSTIYYIKSISDTYWSTIDLSDINGITIDDLTDMDNIKSQILSLNTDNKDVIDIQNVIRNLNVKEELTSKVQLPSLPGTDKEKLFILTIPGFGIRIYKRGYFDTNTVVRVRALKYTTVDDINYDEFQKISITGTELVLPVGYDKPSKDYVVSKYTHKDNSKWNDTGIIPEISREDSKSLLYNANVYERLQGKILSNSDLNMLFTDRFIDKVISATNYYIPSPEVQKGTSSITKFTEGNAMIYYIPRSTQDLIDDVEFENDFVMKYGSYFINKVLSCEAGRLVTITVDASLIVNNTEDDTLQSNILKILNEYAYRLNDPTLFNGYLGNNASYESINILKQRNIRSEISKLSNVISIESLVFSNYDFDTNGMASDQEIQQYVDSVLNPGLKPTDEKYKKYTFGCESGDTGNEDGTHQVLPPAYIPILKSLNTETGELRSTKSLLLIPTYYKFELGDIRTSNETIFR